MTKLTQIGSQASQQLSSSLCQELSKQLCELCGVEPNRDKCNKCQNCSTCENFKGMNGNRFNKFKSIEECQLSSIRYPDFGEPENFVKLIELKPLKTHKPLFGEVTALTYFFNKSAFILDCRKDFLKMLINTINGYSDDFIQKSSQAKIKQSIREAEWKYE